MTTVNQSIVGQALDKRSDILDNYREHLENLAINGTDSEYAQSRKGFESLESIFNNLTKELLADPADLKAEGVILFDYKNFMDMQELLDRPLRHVSASEEYNLLKELFKLLNPK